MKQKAIVSQTTQQCNHHPKPSDYQISTAAFIKVNVIDSLKAAAFLGFGITVFIAVTSLSGVN